MLERRRHRRRNLDRNGQICVLGANGGNTFDCVVKDISVSGAQLLVSMAAIPASFKLGVEGLAGQDCLVRWKSAGAVGVEFVSPLSASG